MHPAEPGHSQRPAPEILLAVSVKERAAVPRKAVMLENAEF